MNLEYSVQKVLENLSYDNQQLALVYEDENSDVAQEIIRQAGSTVLAVNSSEISSHEESEKLLSVIKAHMSGPDRRFLYLSQGSEHVTPLLRGAAEYAMDDGRTGGLSGITSDRLIQTFSGPDSQAFSQELYEYLLGATDIHVRCPQGTDVHVVLDNKKYSLVNSNGIVHENNFANPIPAEVFAFPADVNGTIVASASYIDKTSSATVRWDVQGARITRVSSPDATIQRMAYERIFELDPVNGNRVGESGYPANLSVLDLEELPDNILFHEKGRVHFAHGAGYPKRTGCPYESSVHEDALIEEATVTNMGTGEVIMKNGEYSSKLFDMLYDANQ